jgi:predicted ribosome quality control (RQC) complex YloA/Tae2 family protein
MKTTTIDDFTVIIGGNAQENEDLIKRSAADDIGYIWKTCRVRTL